jgi:ribosome-binding protein aMBF1 (putative translation factor)
MAKKINNDFQRLLDEELKNPRVAAAFHEEKEAIRLSAKIHKLRKEHGLTQEELAEKLGTTQSVIARMESESYTGHSIKMLRRLARALNVKLVIDLKPIHDSR